MDEENSQVIDRPVEYQNITANPHASQIIATSYSGPIPSAFELQAYERVVPGSANRIIEMAEHENLHRHHIELNLVQANVKLANKEATERMMGQSFAFIIAMSCIVGGLALVYFGKSVTGTIFSGTGIVSIAAVFYSNKILRLVRKRNI